MTTTRSPRGEPVPRQAPLVVALVPAAGRGLRMGGSVPKQFLSLGGEPLVIQSLRALQAAPVVGQIILAVPPADVEYCEHEIVSRQRFTKVTKVVAGGAERQDSVRHALAQIPSEHRDRAHTRRRTAICDASDDRQGRGCGEERGSGDYCASDAGYREAGTDGWDD